MNVNSCAMTIKHEVCNGRCDLCRSDIHLRVINLQLRAAFSPAHHLKVVSTRPTLRLLCNVADVPLARDEGLPIPHTVVLEERPRLPSTARFERCIVNLIYPSKLARSSLQRVAWSILGCARRTNTFLLCAFREQQDDQATLPILPRLRVPLAGGGRSGYP